MRKAFATLTLEETVKLMVMILIAASAFALIAWGVGHVETVGEYFGLSPSGGDIELVEYSVDSGVFTATVEFSNTADEEQDMWIEMEGSNPRGLFSGGPSSYDLDRHPSGNGEVTLAPGESTGEVDLSGSHHDAGCSVEIRGMASCGGRWLCSGGRTLDSVTIRLYEEDEVHSEWEGECQ